VIDGEKCRQFPLQRISGLGIIGARHDLKGDELRRRVRGAGHSGIETSGQENRTKATTTEAAQNLVPEARLKFVAGLRCTNVRRVTPANSAGGGGAVERQVFAEAFLSK